MHRIPYVIASLLALGGCAAPVPSPPLQPRERITPLTEGDVLRPLVGTWRITFAVDSVLGGYVDNRAVMRAASGSSVSGTLQLLDTLVEGRVRGLRAALDIDFTPALGRQVSCFRPGHGVVGITVLPHEVSLWFTPGAGDCGFRGGGTWRGDSVVGRWSEDAYVGFKTVGRFRMLRIR